MKSTRRSSRLQTGKMAPLPKRPKTFTGANPLLPNLNLQPPSPSVPPPPSTQPSPSLVPPPKPPRQKQVARKNTRRSRKPLNKLYSSSSSSPSDRDPSPPVPHPVSSSSPPPSPPVSVSLPKPPAPPSSPQPVFMPPSSSTKPSMPTPSVPHSTPTPPPSPTKPSSSVPPQAQSSPTPTDAHFPYRDGFWDASFQTKFARSFANRQVLPEMLFDFPRLSSLPIRQYFDRQHWGSRCFSPTCLDVAPRMVRLFYCNLKPLQTDPYSVVSLVDSTTLSLTETSLGQLLDLPVTGLKIDGDDPLPTFPKSLLQATCFDPLYRDTHHPPKSRYLHSEAKLLFHMVTHFFIPRFGNRDRLNYSDLLFIHCLITGVQINLPYLILRTMIKIATNDGWALGYGLLLNEVFLHSNLQPLLEKEQLPLKDDLHVYREANLPKFRLVLSEGRWIPKPRRSVSSSSQPSTSGVPAPGSSRSIPPDDSSQAKLDRITSMLLTMKDDVNVQMRLILDHLTSVASRLDRLEDLVDSLAAPSEDA